MSAEPRVVLAFSCPQCGNLSQPYGNERKYGAYYAACGNDECDTGVYSADYPKPAISLRELALTTEKHHD